MHFPSPDLLVGNKIKKLAIEVKSIKDIKKYFTEENIKQLINFSDYFGAQPLIAIKFINVGWYFINPEDINSTKENYVVSIKDAEKRALSFEELINP